MNILQLISISVVISIVRQVATLQLRDEYYDELKNVYHMDKHLQTYWNVYLCMGRVAWVIIWFFYHDCFHVKILCVEENTTKAHLF